MAGAAANPHRRSDIQSALKRAKPSDMLTLEALAAVWGVSKSRFVTVRDTMAEFPEPIPQGTSYIYAARNALKAMLAHETRHDDAAKKRQSRTDAILGNVRKDRVQQQAAGIPIRDLSVMARLAAETRDEERVQGLYVPAAEVAATAGDVFAEISEFMGSLDNKVDPHGLLPPDVRTKIASAGAEALLGLHRRMRDILAADAYPGSARGKTDRARKPRARRKSGVRVSGATG